MVVKKTCTDVSFGASVFLLSFIYEQSIREKVCDPLDISRSPCPLTSSTECLLQGQWMLTGPFQFEKALQIFKEFRRYKSFPLKNIKYFQSTYRSWTDYSKIITYSFIYLACLFIFFQTSNLGKHPEYILEQMKQTQNTFLLSLSASRLMFIFI